MMFLGFNEFMALVYSPIMALALIVVILFCRSLYIEMDVDNEMQKGALPGAISLAGKFVPSVKSISNKSIDSVMQFIKQEEAEPNRTADGTSGAASSSSSQPEGLRQRIPPAQSLSARLHCVCRLYCVRCRCRRGIAKAGRSICCCPC